MVIYLTSTRKEGQLLYDIVLVGNKCVYTYCLDFHYTRRPTMQKIALIADIHGNLQAFEAVLNDIYKQGISEILVLGDIIVNGVYPSEVLDIIMTNSKIKLVIMGSEEDKILKYHNGERSYWKDFNMTMPFVWTYEQLSKKHIDYIEALPYNANYQSQSSNMLITHGTPRNVNECIFKDNIDLLKVILGDVKSDVYAYGHSHQSWNGYINNKLVINPGSVGIPQLEKGLTEYTILSDNMKGHEIEQRIINYDVDGFIKEMKDRMTPECETWIKAVITSICTGNSTLYEFYYFARELANQENYDSKLPISNEIWELADKNYEWVGI